MSYTPGPWKTDGLLIKSGFGTQIAKILGGPLNPQNDARLIACAPDLLAALKELVARCDGEEGVGADGSNVQTIAAHAAIKKAEGE